MNVLLAFILLLALYSMHLSGYHPVNGILPQVHQEGILRPFKSYSDVLLFHYYVPTEATVVNFEFAAFMDHPKCPVRVINIYLQHGSYPVMSADNSSFPNEYWINRTSLTSFTVKSSYSSHDATVVPVHNPRPGNWFAAAYIAVWSRLVQQEGLYLRCRYTLGSVALWTVQSDVIAISLKQTNHLTSIKHFTYYKFYIPSGVTSYRLVVNRCHFLTSRWFPENNKYGSSGSGISDQSSKNDKCIQNISWRATALPHYDNKAVNNSVTTTDSIIHIEELPVTDTYHYLLIVTETKVAYDVSIDVEEYPSWTLGKSLLQQFSGKVSTSSIIKDRVVQMLNTSNVQISPNESLPHNDDKSEEILLSTCNFTPTFRLTRIKHAQDFSDTFLLEGKEWFTTWLALTDSNPDIPIVGTSFQLLPFIDIGGTLSISNATSQTVHVEMCVRKNRPPGTYCCNYTEETTKSCCNDGTYLHVSTTNLSTVNAAVYIPFPEPDTYFISFKMHCETKGSVETCALPESLISLDIRTQPCALTKHAAQGTPNSPCGSYGYCQEVHKGQFFFTACKCIADRKGWACTDDSVAIPDNVLLMTTLLLTSSNVFFIPAIFLALSRRMFVQAFIYFCTMISSTMYHACDQDLYGYCLTRYSVLQFCDFFCSILAFWVTLIALAHSPQEYDSLLYIFGSVVIAVGVEFNRTGLFVFVVPFVLGFTYVIIIWLFRSYRRRAIIIPKISSALLFIPGVLLGASGLVLFAFVETEENYRYTHSAWHAIIAISLLYLLPKRKVLKMGLAQHSSVAELTHVNDTYQQPSTSPVFFVTSELDHLVDDRPR